MQSEPELTKHKIKKKYLSYNFKKRYRMNNDDNKLRIWLNKNIQQYVYPEKFNNTSKIDAS